MIKLIPPAWRVGFFIGLPSALSMSTTGSGANIPEYSKEWVGTNTCY